MHAIETETKIRVPELAQQNAEAIVPNWTERALGYVKEYACYEQTFTGEQVRMYAEACGFDAPVHKRAWGSVLLAAARRGIVKKIGTQAVTNPRAHCALATLWGVA